MDFSLNAGLFLMVVFLAIGSYRVWRGPTAADRLQAFELANTLLVGIIVLVGVVLENSLIIDVGIALAAFSFIGTLAIARYLAEGRVF
jgi:multisubunit Na+/H+ antiporter MnhF subunit